MINILANVEAGLKNLDANMLYKATRIGFLPEGKAVKGK